MGPLGEPLHPFPGGEMRPCGSTNKVRTSALQCVESGIKIESSHRVAAREGDLPRSDKGAWFWITCS